MWIYEDEDSDSGEGGGGGMTEMMIDPGDLIRFRVKEEIFENSKPKMGNSEETERVIPYKIIAAIDEDGLGPVTWWN